MSKNDKKDKRIKPTTLPKKHGKISANLLSDKSKKSLAFSLKYFDHQHDKFSLANKKSNYFITLLQRLKDLSTSTREELISNGSKSLRCHGINWSDSKVSETCFGIPNEEQLVDKPYQISLSSNAHGRVHGFFIEETFYIVWLDPDHLLYSSKR
ncbi:hypothetical protein [Gloeocapsa sp. PCC 73106]|uniref:hypothetical protein n=1 Tax=Gloeocapsa sp. PCC 73106 TaxID=102232 RepID=UPI0002ABACE7|nr:hypothetical protein [Gloeocapsa sp. PCC 73106]ELR96862.1 hypothetical protein GLO73106DRAFT_00006610 [Gloeocapsa sp. PCC 73106]